MRIINKKYLLIIILVGVILTGAIILKPNEEVKLDNVVLKQEINNKTFAMYKEDSENNYVKVEDNKFPDMYVLNLTKSKCIDNNGNELDGVLSYENDKVTITSGNTTYCYLYFDKSLGLEIKEKKPSGLCIDQIRGAMYRYQGQAKDESGKELVNNYICFGTSDQNTCKGDTDHYMYRIIGIEAETGRVKVIKKEALKDQISWADNDRENIEFPDSKIYEAINGIGFLQNEDYIPNGWKEKISDNTWMYGDTIAENQDGKEMYKIESAQKETKWYNYATKETPDALSIKANNPTSPYKEQMVYYTEGKGLLKKKFEGKVSLMYLHDYIYSINDTTNCNKSSNNYEICQTGWMHLSQNDLDEQSNLEYTMVRYGWNIFSGYFSSWHLDRDGYVNTNTIIMKFSIRPVFYINASEKLLSGDGTKDSPFIIKTSN